MFDHFAKEKLDFIKKADKSKIGSIDEGIAVIVDKINSKKDHYTTSSCAGRIVLLEKLTGKKNDSKWIFAKHSKVYAKDIFKALNGQNEIWFKQEPLILHVACRNIDAAKRFLEASRKVFKRTGIISLRDKKIVVEVIGTERIDTIVADKKFIADEFFIKKLVEYANKNLVENKRKSKRLLKVIRDI